MGQDLIKAAAVRAQISQIDKYNSAVNTFCGKYGFLPGDIPDPNASRFGFAARGQYAGEGDGNGILEGAIGNEPGANQGEDVGSGEPAMFWGDLSKAGLVDGSFNTASATTLPASDVTLATSPSVTAYMPQAKIGGGNFVYAYSGGTYDSGGISPGFWATSGINYFGLSQVYKIGVSVACCGRALSNPGLSVMQAYNIDKKIDDGQPQSGKVTAMYLNGDIYWMDGTDSLYDPPSTAATQGTSSTCYDNGDNNNAAQQYSTAQNGGTGINCALSFQMEGAGR